MEVYICLFYFIFLGLMSCFNVVESNMQLRQSLASSLLLPNESLLSISFPSLGVLDFTDPSALPTPNDLDCAGRSVFFPDEGIYQGHPRFIISLSFYLRSEERRVGKECA